MAKASIGNGNKSTSACPNIGRCEHKPQTAASSWLTQDQVRAALLTIDIGPGSRLARCAAYRAFTADTDADELLQEAILRAMASRKCPMHLPIEFFLMGIVRSLASRIIEKRERASVSLVEYASRFSALAQDTHDTLIRAYRAEKCLNGIDQVVAGSAVVETVLDGIDQGLCGRSLAEFANIDQDSLASVRRTIKRRVTIVWRQLGELDEAA